MKRIACVSMLMLLVGCAAAATLDVPEALRTACPDLSDSDLQDAITAFTAVRDEGTTREEVEQSSRDNCQAEAPDQADCVPCLLAIIDEVWPAE